MKRLFALAALAAALVCPASAQQSAALPGRLPPGVTPVSYEITITPNAQAMTLAGQVKINIQVTSPTREIVLNALDLSFDHVDIDGSRTAPRVRFDARTQTAHLSFAQPVRAGAHALNISYRGKIYTSSAGMFISDYPANGHTERALFTQFEAADARRFVPCWDEPGVKSVFQINAIVPANRMAVSNMPQTAVDALPNHMQRVHFAPSPKMSSYLMFLGVGDFERIKTNVGGVEIGVITKRGDTAQGRFALDSAAQLLTYYNDYFGVAYPLPKLDLIAGPGAGGFGAMENWGAIFYFENDLLIDPQLSSESDRQNVFVVIAHEMAHQWFGDLVTMGWWDEIWLNEGFASWMEDKATEHFHPDWNIWLQSQGDRQRAMDQDGRATTHPVVQRIDSVDQANQAFDDITYQKGRAVIRMLETYVGADPFRDGVRAYMHDHAYGTGRTPELWAAIEHAANEPIHQIADDFTLQPGIPLISAEEGPCRRNSRELTLHQSRFGLDQASRAPLRWHAPVAAALIGRSGSAGSVIDNNGTAHLTLGGCGPYVINPGQTSYYRVLYSRDAFAQIARNFGRVSADDQYGVLSDARALGTTGAAPYSDPFELTLHTPANANPIVWQLIASQLAGTDNLYYGLPGANAYRAFARARLQPVFARVGWDKKPHEPDNDALLRESLIRTLGQLGDSTVIAEARRRYEANALPGDLRRAALTVIGQNADQATFNELLQRARAANSTLEKTLIYMSLAQARDQAIADQALSHAFDSDLPSAIGARMITAVSVLHAERAWRFAQAHQSELNAQLDPFARTQYLPGLANTANDPAMLQELRRYVDAMPADVRANGQEDYLRLEQRLQVRAQRLPELDRWITAHRG